MKKVNVFEAKARFSECLDAAERGEPVIICRRNHPVAELRAIARPRTAPRPLGGAKGLTVPDSFFAPLPDDVVDGFYGDVSPEQASRAAARPPSARKSTPPSSKKRSR